MVDFDDKFQFVVTKKDLAGHLFIIGVVEWDWRQVLATTRISVLLELLDPSDSQLSTGVLDVTLELYPEERMHKEEFNFFVNVILCR